MLPVAVVLLLQAFRPVPAVFTSTNGRIHIRSDAPLELIDAESEALTGSLDAEKKTFAFRVPIRSFMGFNSELQREHFNENYMESDKFREATFAGKIVESVNLMADGHYVVRAKGILAIHGVEQQRIIQSSITVRNGTLHAESAFTVQLSDYNIKVPKVVHQKIAEVIDVRVTMDLATR
jgi:polyisoprenoid-binding protein YceI